MLLLDDAAAVVVAAAACLLLQMLLLLTMPLPQEIVRVLEEKRQQLLRICSKRPMVGDKEWDAM